MTAAENTTLPRKTQRAPRLTRRQRNLRNSTLTHLVLLVGVVLMFIPLVWTLSTSLKSPGEVYHCPPTWIPQEILWSNYVKAVTAIPFFLYLWNTVVITALSVIGKVVSITLVACSFARLRWWGREFYVRGDAGDDDAAAAHHAHSPVHHVQMVGLNRHLSAPGGARLFWRPLPDVPGASVPAGHPRELDDTAQIDGCSDFGLYWRIIMPLAKPAILIVIIFVFNGTWNEFLLPLIYLQSSNLFTLALGLRMFQGEASTSWNLLMAACC